MAVSPRLDSQATKTARQAAKPTKSPMISEEFHGQVEPPHWSASRIMMQAGAKSKNPIGSKRWMASESVGLVSVLSLVSGILMRAIIVNVTAPAGRFM